MHSIQRFRILINASRVNQWKVKILSTLYASLKRVYIYISISILSQSYRLNNRQIYFQIFIDHIDIVSFFQKRIFLLKQIYPREKRIDFFNDVFFFSKYREKEKWILIFKE